MRPSKKRAFAVRPPSGLSPGSPVSARWIPYWWAWQRGANCVGVRFALLVSWPVVCFLWFFASQSKIGVRKKEGGGAEPLLPDFWFETVDTVKQECRFDALGRLSVSSVSSFFLCKYFLARRTGSLVCGWGRFLFLSINFFFCSSVFLIFLVGTSSFNLKADDSIFLVRVRFSIGAVFDMFKIQLN